VDAWGLGSVIYMHIIQQWFSNFVRPRSGKLFFYKTRARSQQIYS
jgi:hypothetical protein